MATGNSKTNWFGAGVSNTVYILLKRKELIEVNGNVYYDHKIIGIYQTEEDAEKYRDYALKNQSGYNAILNPVEKEDYTIEGPCDVEVFDR